jgi:3-oxoacyl-[acyl-carrier protein] reductase
MSGVAIVTGAAGGLGRVYCLALSEAGWTVAAADLVDAAPVVAEVEAAGGTALGVRVDVTDRASTEELAQSVVERFGGIDALVNNAAHYSAIVKRPFEEIEDEEWTRCFDVNVKGAWLCARAVVPAMKERGRGKIVNVSSMTVPTAPPGFAHYIASKAAIVGLTRALARELGPFGICVNTLTPDYVAFDREYDNRQPEMAPALAAQRVFARAVQPDDLVGTLLYLLGPGSDFVTGQNVWVNGGRAFQ